MKGRVVALGLDRSKTGKTYKYYAEVRVDLGWKKDYDDANKEIEKLSEELIGKKVMMAPLKE